MSILDNVGEQFYCRGRAFHSLGPPALSGFEGTRRRFLSNTAAEPAAVRPASGRRYATRYIRDSLITSNIAPCGSAITEKRPTFGMSVGGT